MEWLRGLSDGARTSAFLCLVFVFAVDGLAAWTVRHLLTFNEVFICLILSVFLEQNDSGISGVAGVDAWRALSCPTNKEEMADDGVPGLEFLTIEGMDPWMARPRQTKLRELCPLSLSFESLWSKLQQKREPQRR
jgi:hypothetical protein